MPKTINTPEPERLLKIIFQGARIDEMKLSDAATGSFKFVIRVGNGKPLEMLCRKLECQVPEEKTTEQGIDKKLEGGSLTLLCETTIGKNVEIDMPYKAATSFKLVRRELVGKKGKGWRRELHFSGTFDDTTGAARFESYMTRTNNAEGVLTLTYLKEPAEQSKIPLTEAQQAALPEND
jgi:hypothetical protein